MSASKPSTSAQAIIAPIAAYAQQALPAAEATSFIQFLQLYYSQAYQSSLEDYTPEHLFQIALSHRAFMEKRHPDESKVRVFNPQQQKEGWTSQYTIIQIVTEDRPFLVDSIRMALNQRHLTTHLMLYMGGINIKRNPEGLLTQLIPYTDTTSTKKKGTTEAPIYIEIDQQTETHVLNDIQASIIRVIEDVRIVVSDWRQMQQRLRETITLIKSSQAPLPQTEVEETIAFLQWILDDHFTFLGARDYEKLETAAKGKAAARLLPGTGLGVLRNEERSTVLRYYSELPKAAREIALSRKHILIISKTNTRSSVHRPTYTDYIGIKILSDAGSLLKERRFIGLYTSSAYNTSPKAIPFIRKKVATIIKRSGLPARSHAGKDLMHILSTLPRDDLFNGTVHNLYNLAMNIASLQERRKTRLFILEDTYGRYVSCLVYLPKENFNTDVQHKMLLLLNRTFHGTEINFNTYFSTSILARIHFSIRLKPHTRPRYHLDKLEKQLAIIAKSWHDGFREAMLEYFGETQGMQMITKYYSAFPASYREIFTPDQAAKDIEHIERLSEKHSLEMSFYQLPGTDKELIQFKLFRLHQTVPLSDALPMLENMGLRVISEQQHCIPLPGKLRVWINDFGMHYSKEPTFEVEEVKSIFQTAFWKIWLGEAESDGFNRLVLEAQLDWREIAVLRSYAKYLKQTGFIYSSEYIAETLVNNAGIAHLLKDLFTYRFHPNHSSADAANIEKIERLIKKMLDDVAILDEDRILRRYIALVRATLRTNYYQTTSNGELKSYFSFKFDSSLVPDLPLPLPKYEIFVYSARFEGIHLRADKVARGGIRWSDRREDFRTEVLELMKAQQVKNALIVPDGAKGGFFPKNIPTDSTREAIFKEGAACYRDFIRGLLDLTDNLKNTSIESPDRVLCYDDHDTYLVVAADKGTASFSDMANAISLERGYWLGDAFASGGSTGYDHKKIGITAKGAWVSAQRHFQALGTDIDHSEITVIGIGDMSGDVFGNGMLLSKHIKLVAAFNHTYIFIDPTPDPLTSYKERRRLSRKSRSNWDDYDLKKLSKGGGIFRRSAKSITLTPEIKARFSIEEDCILPNTMIRMLLRAPVDMLWNGGIGTYIKSSQETNDKVSDRANDAVRVDGKEVRARIVCEGGNLGLTQLGRIEYEAYGGKINTDFIDNSAGVDCSDHEVNIKILLDALVATSRLSETQRNTLLSQMTHEVSKLVLENNNRQNRAISLATFQSSQKISLYARYLDKQEEARRINRSLEFLPDRQTLLERKSRGAGLARSEMAILFAYSKTILKDKIFQSDLPSDPSLSQYMAHAFPASLRDRYPDALTQHRLYREIISTQLSNHMISYMGPTFHYQMKSETNASDAAIFRSYAIAHQIYHMEKLHADIESLDYHVDWTTQLQMTSEVVQLVRRVTRWFLRNARERGDIQQAINSFSQHVPTLFRRLPKLILGEDRRRLEAKRNSLIASHVNPDIALRITNLVPMYHALNIIDAANTESIDLFFLAKIYFVLVDRLDLLWFRDQINEFPAEGQWAILAKAGYKEDLDHIQRALAIEVATFNTKAKDVTSRINAWLKANQPHLNRWQSILSALHTTVSLKQNFEVFPVAIRVLTGLLPS